MAYICLTSFYNSIKIPVLASAPTGMEALKLFSMVWVLTQRHTYVHTERERERERGREKRERERERKGCTFLIMLQQLNKTIFFLLMGGSAGRVYIYMTFQSLQQTLKHYCYFAKCPKHAFVLHTDLEPSSDRFLFLNLFLVTRNFSAAVRPFGHINMNHVWNPNLSPHLNSSLRRE